MACRKKEKGLTLVEIAIVLVILGILIGLGAAFVGPLTKRVKISETRDILNASVESIVGFVAKNNRLPGPTEFRNAVRNPNDAWGKALVYFVDENLTSVPPNPAEGICGRKLTNIIVCLDATCTNQIPNVAFVVVSGAGNFNVQTGPLSVSPGGKQFIRVYEQDTPNIDEYAGDFTRPEEYDDLVKWVALDELRIKVGCQGSQLKILNNELPWAYVGTPYSATIYAEGGVPFSTGGKYKWCRQGDNPAGLTFNPNVSSTNCITLPEGSWGQSTSLTISGTPTTAGTYNLTFFVRDNQDSAGSDDNITQKSFVLTINTSTSGGGGIRFRIWNNTGAQRDFTLSGVCRNNINQGSEVTSSTLYLEEGGYFLVHASDQGTCNASVILMLDHNNALAADSNGNRELYVTTSGFVDR
ncbi:MAG: prepilin-type N-terminal cleavage/methylation domain-containing protein [Syntrophales bacterium]|nr:prepilin-type N-terminal cleavage/methylation domain-containing protein [Syntrophales bacterium]